jgi:hypothetical protein
MLEGDLTFTGYRWFSPKAARSALYSRCGFIGMMPNASGKKAVDFAKG